MIIGLGYKAGTGKDTLGSYLQYKYGFDSSFFAKNLKDFCQHELDISYNLLYTRSGKKASLETPVVFNEELDDRVLKWIKKHSTYLTTSNLSFPDLSAFYGHVMRTPRDVIQFIGTDVIRSYYKNYHVDVCMGSLDTSKDYVITDLRFLNEAEGILDAGGVCVKLNRTGSNSLESHNSKHSSETALDDFTQWFYTINNLTNIPNKLYIQGDILIRRIKNAFGWRQCNPS